jgi:hypothetical protein
MGGDAGRSHLMGIAGHIRTVSNDLQPGSIRNSKGHPSLWRVPNFLFEARGLFLGETDETILRIARWRALTGFLLIVGLTLRFQGTKVFGYSYLPKHAPNEHVVLPFESAEVTTIAISTAVALAASFLTAATLVSWAAPAARPATISQLRWPLTTMLVFSGYMALMVLLFARVIPEMEGRLAYWKSAVRYLWILVIAIVWVSLAACLLKSLYLVVTGLFRADDGHPLLAPIAYPAALAVMAGYATLHDGAHQLPGMIGPLSLWLGPATALILSIWALLRMRKKYTAFPFRGGPLRASPDVVPVAIE